MTFQAYVYCIRNKQTGEFYYGSRSANIRKKRTPEQDFRHHYQSSSTIMKRNISAFGIEAFEWQIIMTGETLDCYWEEQQLIKGHRLDPLCLNRHFIDPAGGIAFCVAGRPKSSEHRAKIGAAQKGRPRSEQERANLSKGQKNKALPSAETCAKISAGMMGRPVKDETRAKLRAAFTGKPRSAETIRKMSESRKGIPLSQEQRDRLVALHTGKPLSEKHKESQRAAWQKRSEQGLSLPKITCPHCGKTGTAGNMRRWHFDNCRQ
jgi:hypothetical protein